ncbi:transporter substrate-binding domain-containing protein [Streptomyces shenzhenensis]|uniref:transporter substrate-binding domain-containing protein n=1 Tax=Streptomyces shenzhenensis TaxID=943815 RepID=UPI0033F6706B
MNVKIRRPCTVLAAAGLGFVVSACGSEPEASAPAPADVEVQASSEVVALLPEQVERRGTLRVAIPDSGVPLATKENGELRGMDPGLGKALAQVMGLRFQPQMIPFSSALPGLQAGRYDVSFGEFYVTAERVKVADFVTAWRDFSSFVVWKDAKVKPQSLADVCGLQVGAMDGSVELKFLNDTQADCAAQGKQPITINAFPSISAGVLALSSNRVQAVLANRGGGENAIAKGQSFTLAGQIGGGPTATAVARTAYSEQMLKAVRKAYEVLIANGAYSKILEANNTSYGAIDNPTIYTTGSSLPDYE